MGWGDGTGEQKTDWDAMGVEKGEEVTLESDARGAEEVAVGVDGDLGGRDCHIKERKWEMGLVASQDHDWEHSVED